MKKFTVVIAILLCLTISALIIYGCGEKKAEQEVEQQVEEQVEEVQEEAVVDTAAVDTTMQQQE